jgi:hypothetical protein
VAELPRHRGPAPGRDRGSGRRRKVAQAPPVSAALRSMQSCTNFRRLMGWMTE